jgi:thiamine pyrophosphokinase
MFVAASFGGRFVRVLGVLDGRDMPPAQLRVWAASADLVLAADGAADLLLTLGVHPTIVIGDMDGISRAPHGLTVIKDEDTERTDCDKLLGWAQAHGYTGLTLANIEGDLLDHVLSTLSSCVPHAPVRLALRRGLGWVFSGSISIAATPHARVSLLPLTPCTGVSLTGVRWPLADVTLEIGGRVSISNEASGRVEVTIESGSAFLFVERPIEEAPLWD